MMSGYVPHGSVKDPELPGDNGYGRVVDAGKDPPLQKKGELRCLPSPRHVYLVDAAGPAAYAQDLGDHNTFGITVVEVSLLTLASDVSRATGPANRTCGLAHDLTWTFNERRTVL